MKKLIFCTLFVALAGIIIVGCEKEKYQNSADVDFQDETHALKIYEFDYSDEDLELIYESYYQGFTEKVGPGPKPKKKRKWKLSFTFGGGFDACAGGQYCGSCPGICITSGIVGTDDDNDELSEEEISDGFGLAEIVFNNTNGNSSNNPKVIFFYPNRSMDNGDGFVRIDSDFNLGREFASETGKDVTIEQGQYKIVYTPKFPNGVGIFKVK